MVAVASSEWQEEWLGTDDPETTAPWLFDSAGNPIEVPADWIGFRARWIAPGARGFGELVPDHERGGLLFVPRDAGPDEFCAMVRFRAGRYRLAPLDASHRLIETAPVAIYIITPTMEARAAAAADGGAPVRRRRNATGESSETVVLELMALVKQLVSESRNSVREALQEFRSATTDTTSRTASALAESLQALKSLSSDNARSVSELVNSSATLVRAADGAGISRRDPLPPLLPPAAPAQLPAADEAAQPFAQTLANAVEQFTPAVNHWINTRVFGLSDEMSAALLRASAAAKAGAPPHVPPTGAATAPASSAPSASASATSTPAGISRDALIAQMGAIGKHLSPVESAAIAQYLQNASDEHKQQLASEVMSRTVADAVAWIRSLLPEAEADATTSNATNA